jgi:hypothetical protein
MLWQEGALSLLGYCDADMVGDLDTHKFTGGYIFTAASGAVSYCSKLQKVVALSSTEAEYSSATEAAKEGSYLCSTDLMQILACLLVLQC